MREALGGHPHAPLADSDAQAVRAEMLRRESQLFSEHVPPDDLGLAAAPIFILGSPRTGSTILYQAVVAAFGLPYFANLTNDHYAECPIVGLERQASEAPHAAISSHSRFGKTEGLFQPSEASAIMERWFGGGHPSEIVSNAIRPAQEDHFLRTCAAAQRLLGKPLVIKNAWNCFRVRSIARVLPRSTFIWIRRDVAASAMSDLRSRYAVNGSPQVWNSATPRNVEDLRRLPFAAQVVENQFEFARAIAAARHDVGSGRMVEVWYEDFCTRPETALGRIAAEIPGLRDMKVERVLDVHRPDGRADGLRPEDVADIRRYVAQNAGRFADLGYSFENRLRAE